MFEKLLTNLPLFTLQTETMKRSVVLATTDEQPLTHNLHFFPIWNVILLTVTSHNQGSILYQLFV